MVFGCYYAVNYFLATFGVASLPSILDCYTQPMCMNHHPLLSTSPTAMPNVLHIIICSTSILSIHHPLLGICLLFPLDSSSPTFFTLAFSWLECVTDSKCSWPTWPASSGLTHCGQVFSFWLVDCSWFVCFCYWFVHIDSASLCWIFGLLLL